MARNRLVTAGWTGHFRRWNQRWRRLWIQAVLVLGYVVVAAYQLGLPGLHYDESKEAGLNALELLQGAPVTAFREASITLGPWSLPLMVQDYIGALNVYLVMPFLALTGEGVPNLRWPALLMGALTLILLERVVSEWWTWQTRAETALDNERTHSVTHTPITWAGVCSVALLALAPSFVFWSRQGVFVTNLTQPLCLFVVWQGLRWLRHGQPAAFILTGLSAGLALYAKLLAGWILGPFALLALPAFVRIRRAQRRDKHGEKHRAEEYQGAELSDEHSDEHRQRAKTGAGPTLTPALLGAGMAAFLIALGPLILFNFQTGGTWEQLSGNLAQSYYGVDNRAWVENLAVRAGQLVQTLRGDHFWYLGGIYANAVAPWLALPSLGAILLRPRLVGLPFLFLFAAVGFSVFTISDLFITHYALLHPFMVGAVSIGLSSWVVWALAFITRQSRFHTQRVKRLMQGAVVAVVVLWLGADLFATVQYHAALDRSGGLGDHSDATYHFAYHLRYNGMGAPIALDWGMDAPVRFLTENAVRPIEIFGYGSPVEPDADFPSRLALFLENPHNVYLLRSPEQTVFAGRREAFFQQVESFGRDAILLEVFAQRDGAPLFEIWRVE